MRIHGIQLPIGYHALSGSNVAKFDEGLIFTLELNEVRFSFEKILSKKWLRFEEKFKEKTANI